MNIDAKKKFMFTLTILILLSIACGRSTTEELQEAVSPTSIEQEVITNPTLEEDSPVNPTVMDTESPVSPPPASSPTPIPEPISVIKQGFGQDGVQVGYAFVVDNPNESLAFEDSQFQIAAFDESGVVVATDSGYINLLLPGQSLGVGGDLYVGEGVKVSTIDVQLNAGDPELTEPLPTFTVESIQYQPDDYFSKVTGVISSPYNRDITDLRVSAVVYDETGNIIGGGFTYHNFILANGSRGMEVSVTDTGKATSAELYPVLSGLSLLIPSEDLPEGANDLQLIKYGFGQDGNQVGFGMLVNNPNNHFSVESIRYNLTAYSIDGTVTDTEEGYIEVLLPEQALGVAGDLYIGEGMNIDRIGVQIKAGEYVEANPTPIFTSENVTYLSDSYFPKVTGLIVSPYTSDITDLRVSAIAYNEAGGIIGGGFTFLDFAPANSKAAVEVSVTTAGIPAKVELFASVSGLSDVE